MVLYCVDPLRRWRCGCLLILLCCGEQALADDLTIFPQLPNYFSADYGIDSRQGRSLYLFTNLALVKGHRLSLGYGSHDDTVSGSQEELDTRTYNAGYYYNAQQFYQLGVEYEFWGERNKVTTDSYRVFLSLQVDKFSFSVTPQIYTINLYTQSSCQGSLDSRALAWALNYYPNLQWSLNSSYTTYDYNQDYGKTLDCVDNAELPIVISRLQSVADDNELSLGFDYYSDSETYGVNWSRIISAVNHLSTYVASAYASTDIFDDWSVTVTLGVQENFDNTRTKFIRGTLGYYW